MSKILPLIVFLILRIVAVDASPWTTSWGQWHITNLTGFFHSSNLYLQFSVTDDNKPGTVLCNSSISLVGPERPYHNCQDESVRFTVSWNLTSELLYDNTEGFPS